MSQKVFIFSFTGELIDKTDGVGDIVKKYGYNRAAIYTAIKRESIVSGKFYFSYSDTFELPLKRSSHNPMTIKSNSVKKRNKKDSKEYKYSESDINYILSKEVTDKQIANQFNTTVKSIQTIRSKHNK